MKVKSIEVDGKAWINNPKYNYVYNKLWLCRTQKIKAAPVPIEPNRYPVFYKPIMNLYSLGAFSFKAEKPVDQTLHAGLFWMEYLEGRHWTFDCFYDGSIHDVYALEAEKEQDNFSLWKPLENFDLGFVETWLDQHLNGYVGKLNVEGIGDKILEVHLRNSEQMVEMKSGGYDYSAPIFGPDKKYDLNETDIIDQMNQEFPDVKYVITIEDGKPEIGMGDQRRIAYLMGRDKNEIEEAVEQFKKYII